MTLALESPPLPQARRRPTLDACDLVATKAAEGLIQHLGRVARDRREAQDVMLAEISARLRHDYGIKKTEGAFSRFERGETTPTYLDAVVAAYAAELGLEEIALWDEAMDRYREAVKEAGRTAKAGAALEQEAAEIGRQRRAGRAGSARENAEGRRRRAAG